MSYPLPPISAKGTLPGRGFCGNADPSATCFNENQSNFDKREGKRQAQSSRLQDDPAAGCKFCL
jgi:hypothetical protein